MPFWSRLGVVLVACSMLGAQSLPEDPVMKARALRAQAQGIREADLPPVPRGVTDPPPLPPPEAHLKDARQARSGKAVVRKGGRAARTVKHRAAAAPKARKRKH